MTKNKIKKFLRSGGATLNKNGEAVDFSAGYQVSKKDCFILPVADLQTITIKTNKLLEAIKNDFVGLWVDEGLVYIDISKHYNNKTQAIKTGQKLNQLSIFDWASKNCINLK